MPVPEKDETKPRRKLDSILVITLAGAALGLVGAAFAFAASNRPAAQPPAPPTVVVTAPPLTVTVPMTTTQTIPTTTKSTARTTTRPTTRPTTRTTAAAHGDGCLPYEHRAPEGACLPDMDVLDDDGELNPSRAEAPGNIN